jgi:valyl-tRNA synthetase
LFYCFENIVRLIAPFVPFISETIYRNLSQEESVHLQSWPNFEAKFINPKLETDMEEVRELCRLIHAQRQKAGIKVRQPLSLATVNTKTNFSQDLIDIIKEETNFKKIKINKQSNDMSVTIKTTLDDKLIEEGQYRDLVRSIQVLRKENNLQIKDKIKIYAPNWPQKFEEEILQKTLGVSLEKSDNLKVEKVNV